MSVTFSSRTTSVNIAARRTPKNNGQKIPITKPIKPARTTANPPIFAIKNSNNPTTSNAA